MTSERANISEEKIDAIAAAAQCSRERTLEILDPEYTYWSQCGDSTRAEHFEFLETASVERIAGWVASISRDIGSETE